jgi:hypothetical protein
VPNVVEDGASVAEKQDGELAIVFPGASDGVFVNLLALLIEKERNVGDIGLSTRCLSVISSGPMRRGA